MTALWFMTTGHMLLSCWKLLAMFRTTTQPESISQRATTSSSKNNLMVAILANSQMWTQALNKTQMTEEQIIPNKQQDNLASGQLNVSFIHLRVHPGSWHQIRTWTKTWTNKKVCLGNNNSEPAVTQFHESETQKQTNTKLCSILPCNFCVEHQYAIKLPGKLTNISSKSKMLRTRVATYTNRSGRRSFPTAAQYSK